MSPAGIEPATFQFVTQHLNHCATASPCVYVHNIIKKLTKCVLVKLFLYIITPYTFWLLMRLSIVRHKEDNYWSDISVLLFCNYLIQHCKFCTHVYSCHCRMVHYCMKHMYVYHPFNYDTCLLTPYLMYFKLWFYQSHFISWIGSVILIIVSSFNFYPFYCLPGDGCAIGQNMSVVIIYQNYCTSVPFVGIAVTFFNLQLMQGLWIMYSVVYLSFLVLINSLGTLYQQIMCECNFVVMSDNFDAVCIYFMSIRHKKKLLHWIQRICKIIKLSVHIKDYPRRRLISFYQDIFVVMQDRKHTHTVTLWCIFVISVTVETQQCNLSCWGTCHYQLLHSNAFMANLCYWQQLNSHRSSCKVPIAALKQKNVHLLMAVFRCTVLLNRT